MATPDPASPQISPGERALAVLGVKSVISKEVEKIAAPQRHEMADLEKTITKRAKALVAGELKCSWPELPNYKKLLQDLSEQMNDQQAEEMIARLDDDTQLAFMVLAHQSFATLQGALPRSVVRSLSGAKNLDVSGPEFFNFCGLLRVLDDPLQILELAAAGALMKYQVAAVRQLYPTVSKAIDGAIYSAIIDAKTRDDGYELPASAEMGISKWLGIPSDVGVYQKMYADAGAMKGQPNPPSQSSMDAAAKAAQTPAERIEQK